VIGASRQQKQYRISGEDAHSHARQNSSFE
jgi:hypothetical protein